MSPKRNAAAKSTEPSTATEANRLLRDEVLRVIQRFAGHANIVSAPIEFVKATGSLNRAVVLNQIVFWHGVQEQNGRDDGWFYRTYAQWEEETGLGEFKIRGAADWLEREKIIERRLKKAHGAPTLHYRLNRETFTDWILEKLKNRFLRNSGIPVPAETQDSYKQISTSDITNRLTPLPPEGGKGDVVSFPVRNQNPKQKPAVSEDPNYPELMAYLIERGGRDTRKQQRALSGLLARHAPATIRECFDHFFTLPTRQYAVTWATVDAEIDQWVLRQGEYEDMYAGAAEQLMGGDEQPMKTILEREIKCPFSSSEFLEAWGEFERERERNGNPLTTEKTLRLYGEISGFSEHEAVILLRHLLQDGWHGRTDVADASLSATCGGCEKPITQGQRFATRIGNRDQRAHVVCLGLMVATAPVLLQGPGSEVTPCHA